MNGGYSPALGNRQVQMIAIGGAIGVGLFLGAGGRLEAAGPALVLSYAAAGVAAFFVMRALGELVLYRPTSGSFVDYAHTFIGPWAGFATGWMYWVNWAATGVAELTAIATYVAKWAPALPHWITALAALAVVLAVNLLSVRVFGELEFWFALLKVLAIVTFLVVGLALVVFSVGGAGAGNLTAHGGFAPSGFPVVLMSLQSVVFAYASIELVGIAAGETRDPRRVIPKAVNAVVWRIAVFYVGSVLLLAMVLPWTAYAAGESPFVTVFSRLGVPAAGDVMNLIVITAALSSCNSGLYSTGRILRAMALRGEAPAATGRMSGRHVPYGGILFTAAVFLGGVALNYFVPRQAFDIATAVASLGVVTTWGTLVYCQLRLRAAALRGELERPAFRMPGSPWTNWLTLAFLLLVVLLMAVADSAQRTAFLLIPALALAIALGWRAVCARRRRAVPGPAAAPVTETPGAPPR
ncbi:L-asparagine permease [Thermocatellispora tengchongensis]|uniref:L-asparagine permease n=1 Tax=Thermocatellispora tengchongensis TaxID=1073253 RepID=A0A840P2N6_9ACTN|nr:amino acid permease [Thermocatellispora tengchongensis]MBB5131730.1 L-asparagine permease [Thermocatellispora tengchongensis]